MDEALNQYIILIIYLAAAALFDIFTLKIPVYAALFAFCGRLVSGGGWAQNIPAASCAALFVYFISEISGRIRKKKVLGRGDIHIIFIIGIYLDFDVYIEALFFTCIFALIMAALSSLFIKTAEFPLAPAFLFGTMAALW